MTLKIIMMGTGPFAVPTFQWLLASEHEVSMLVTRPPVVNRGKTAPPSPMRVAGQEAGLPIYDPESINDPETIQFLKQQNADLLVVCDYGQILSPDALSVTRLGGINLHGSLLPKYRGAAPVQWCVYHGDSHSGVSVIHMTPRLDGGPVIGQAELEVDRDDTAETLEVKLSQLGVESVRQAIQLLQAWDGRSPMGKLQDPQQVTKAPRLKKQMGVIDWTRSATEIRNQIRAFKPWPGCSTQMQRPNGKWQPLIVDWVETVENAEPEMGSANSGSVVSVGKDHLWVKTGNGILSLTRIQPVGKRLMEIDEFLRGYQPQLGTQFGQPNA